MKRIPGGGRPVGPARCFAALSCGIADDVRRKRAKWTFNFSVTMFPSQNCPGRGGIKPPIVPGRQAADERQNDPRPPAGRVAAFRRVPRFRLRPLRNKEQAERQSTERSRTT